MTTQPKCPRCHIERCPREIFPDDLAEVAKCYRRWAERVERERDEALQLLRELFDHDVVIDCRMSDKAFAIAWRDRFWAFLARFPVKL